MAKQLKKYGPKKNQYTWDPKITKAEWIDRYEGLKESYNSADRDKRALQAIISLLREEKAELEDKLFDWRYWSCAIALMILIGHILLWAGCIK